MIEEQSFNVPLTKAEIKDGVTTATLKINDSAMWRETDLEAFEVAGIVSDDEPKKQTKVALYPFQMFADSEPQDEASAHGVLLKIKTRNNQTIERFVAGADLESGKIWEHLRNLGVRVLPNATARKTVRDYLLSYEAPKVVRTYGKAGWSITDNARTFALGSRIIGDDEARFESIDNHPADCSVKGDVDSWLKNVAAPAEKSVIWSFGILAALAPPLMELVHFKTGGGWHFYGQSSTGKSLILECAASVYGPHAFIKTWNTSDGGLEIMAEAYSGLILCIDELAEATSKTVSRAVYTLSDGKGRASMTQTRNARRTRSWSLLSLSSGEVSIEDKITQKGQTLRGGQALRVADIYAEHEDLQKHLPVQAAQLKAATAKHYGAVGAQFLLGLVRISLSKSELNALQSEYLQVSAAMRDGIKDSRRARAADRFALVRVAGELAQKMGLIPKSYNVKKIVTTVFGVWTNDTAKITLDENRQAARRLVDFIDQEMGQSIALVNYDNEVKHTGNGKRAGWFREPLSDDTPARVYLFKKSVEQAIGEYNLRAFCKAMLKAELLFATEGHFTHPTPAFYTFHLAKPSHPRTYQFNIEALRKYVDHGVTKQTEKQTNLKGKQDEFRHGDPRTLQATH
tara:strand:- start:103 stop:1986 length:1884 start_codon:yes stop_codon:yes gene_type:complete